MSSSGQAETPNANVVFPRPRGGPYTYLLPEDLDQPLIPGVRVVAPFGRRLLTGVIFETNVLPPKGIRLIRFHSVLDEHPLVLPDLLDLVRWLAGYYFCDLGEALRAVVPGIFLRVGDRKVKLTGDPERPALKLSPLQDKILFLLRESPGGQLPQSRLAGRLKTRSLARPLSALAESGLVEISDHLPLIPRARSRTMLEAGALPDAAELECLLRKTPRQRECLDYLRGVAGPVEVSLLSRLNFSPAVVGALAKKGLVNKYEVYDPRDPFRNVQFPDYTAPRPSEVQAGVIRRVMESGGRHRVFLLHGVTGSGKTLVYMELLRPLLEQGKQAIVLVPEIALTPQTTGRFRAVFGPRVAVLHSGLSEGERYDIWRQIHEGRYAVAVGARSAVFAPFDNLGIIIVDEEHENSYKQDSPAPPYNAREVAIRRMQLAGGPVLLGSATPSLESYQRARDGGYTLLELPERVLGRSMPAVQVYDLRKGWKDGKKPSLIGERLLGEIGFALEAGGQVLLLLNRRGYNNFLLCEECGQVPGCDFCRISFTLHRRLNRLLCHYCGTQKPIPSACPACGAQRLSPTGMGTEQVETILREHFPGRKVDRMDLDTTGGKWSHHEILERLRAGETDILVGTQMIAKGLDFPNVLLVGVVNADTAMNLPDFRATERTFGLLAQVAGRTGRGERGGEVIIQTFNPAHPAVKSAVGHDYAAFAGNELSIRGEAGYPPFVSLLNVIFSGRDETALSSFADRTAQGLEKFIARESLGGLLEAVGPSPCPLEKLRGRYRYHLILKSADEPALQTAGAYLARSVKPPRQGDCRMTLDRDPASLM